MRFSRFARDGQLARVARGTHSKACKSLLEADGRRGRQVVASRGTPTEELYNYEGNGMEVVAGR